VQRPVANTVYRDRAGELRPVALIDWDIAAPGRRIHDIAHVCWQYAGLGPEIEDTAQACWQIRSSATPPELRAVQRRLDPPGTDVPAGTVAGEGRTREAVRVRSIRSTSLAAGAGS